MIILIYFQPWKGKKMFLYIYIYIEKKGNCQIAHEAVTQSKQLHNQFFLWWIIPIHHLRNAASHQTTIFWNTANKLFGGLSCCCTELVVAESVVVIKKLLQMQPEKHSDIIKHMAKLTDNIQVGHSQTAAVWCLDLTT